MSNKITIYSNYCIIHVHVHNMYKLIQNKDSFNHLLKRYTEAIETNKGYKVFFDLRTVYIMAHIGQITPVLERFFEKISQTSRTNIKHVTLLLRNSIMAKLLSYITTMDKSHNAVPITITSQHKICAQSLGISSYVFNTIFS